MSWTLDIIRKRIRNLCTIQSTNQLSDESLNEYINRFYSWQLPKEIKPIQLETWYEVTLSDGVESYDLKKEFYDEYIKLDPLAYISTHSGRKEYYMSIYYSLSDFYSIWPDGTDYTDSGNTSRPSSILIYNNQLLFRKCPDDTYYVSIKATRRPLVYVSGATTTSNEFQYNTDIPEYQEWGQYIVYGTSKAILEELGDANTLQSINSLYMNEKANLHSQTLGWYTETRAKPKF